MKKPRTTQISTNEFVVIGEIRGRY